jgi:hypothetical protein
MACVIRLISRLLVSRNWTVVVIIHVWSFLNNAVILKLKNAAFVGVWGRRGKGFSYRLVCDVICFGREMCECTSSIFIIYEKQWESMYVLAEHFWYICLLGLLADLQISSHPIRNRFHPDWTIYRLISSSPFCSYVTYSWFWQGYYTRNIKDDSIIYER